MPLRSCSRTRSPNHTGGPSPRIWCASTGTFGATPSRMRKRTRASHLISSLWIARCRTVRPRTSCSGMRVRRSNRQRRASDHICSLAGRPAQDQFHDRAVPAVARRSQAQRIALLAHRSSHPRRRGIAQGCRDRRTQSRGGREGEAVSAPADSLAVYVESDEFKRRCARVRKRLENGEVMEVWEIAIALDIPVWLAQDSMNKVKKRREGRVVMVDAETAACPRRGSRPVAKRQRSGELGCPATLGTEYCARSPQFQSLHARQAQAGWMGRKIPPRDAYEYAIALGS